MPLSSSLYAVLCFSSSGPKAFAIRTLLRGPSNNMSWQWVLAWVPETIPEHLLTPVPHPQQPVQQMQQIPSAGKTVKKKESVMGMPEVEQAKPGPEHLPEQPEQRNLPAASPSPTMTMGSGLVIPGPVTPGHDNGTMNQNETSAPKVIPPRVFEPDPERQSEVNDEESVEVIEDDNQPTATTCGSYSESRRALPEMRPSSKARPAQKPAQACWESGSQKVVHSEEWTYDQSWTGWGNDDAIEDDTDKSWGDYYNQGKSYYRQDYRQDYRPGQKRHYYWDKNYNYDG